MICLARYSCAWTYVCACPRLGSGPFRCLWWMFLIDRQRSSVPYATFSLTFTHIWLKLSSVHSISNTCRSPPRSLNRLALSSSGSLHTFTPQLLNPKLVQRVPDWSRVLESTREIRRKRWFIKRTCSGEAAFLHRQTLQELTCTQTACWFTKQEVWWHHHGVWVSVITGMSGNIKLNQWDLLKSSRKV